MKSAAPGVTTRINVFQFKTERLRAHLLVIEIAWQDSGKAVVDRSPDRATGLTEGLP
jgi:hypothetical protein